MCTRASILSSGSCILRHGVSLTYRGGLLPTMADLRSAQMRTARRIVTPLAAAVLAAGAVAAVTFAPDPVGAAADPLQDAIAASAAPGTQWEPGPEAYGEVRQADVPVPMADGTVLRANIAYPTDLATGQP